MYRELEDGRVELTMMRDDYERLLFALGLAAGDAMREGNVPMQYALLRLVNRLNEGNPQFGRYDVPEAS